MGIKLEDFEVTGNLNKKNNMSKRQNTGKSFYKKKFYIFSAILHALLIFGVVFLAPKFSKHKETLKIQEVDLFNPNGGQGGPPADQQEQKPVPAPPKQEKEPIAVPPEPKKDDIVEKPKKIEKKIEKKVEKPKIKPPDEPLESKLKDKIMNEWTSIEKKNLPKNSPNGSQNKPVQEGQVQEGVNR